MATMYEMIMDLPLFKGVGPDQVSLFLEKTNVGFQNFDDGETVAELSDPVKMVKFVISGEVLLSHPLRSLPVSVEERSGFGKVLGADRLFGMATGYPYSATSIGKTSIMEFSKEQYINLLHSDRIYMLNFFNFLSLRAQRPIDAIMAYSRYDIHSCFCELVSVLTDQDSAMVTIKGANRGLADFCGVSERDIEEWKRKIEARGIAECLPDMIRIKSRRLFLDS